MSQFQGSVHSSALFLTAAAQNLLCLKLATEMGVVIFSPWVTWVKGALAPALVGMLVTPLLMFKVSHFPLSPCCTRFPPPVWCLFFSWVILRGLLTLTCSSLPCSSPKDQSSYVSSRALYPSRPHSKQQHPCLCLDNMCMMTNIAKAKNVALLVRLATMLNLHAFDKSSPSTIRSWSSVTQASTTP